MSTPQSKVIKFEQIRRVRSSARPKRRFRFKPGRWLALVGIIYLLFTFGDQEFHLFKMRAEMSRLREQIRQVQTDNERLRQEIQSLNDDAYIEKAAREELGMVKANEITYIPAVPR